MRRTKRAVADRDNPDLAAARRARHSAASPHAGVLIAMQRSAGNARVADLLSSRAAPPAFPLRAARPRVLQRVQLNVSEYARLADTDEAVLVEKVIEAPDETRGRDGVYRVAGQVTKLRSQKDGRADLRANARYAVGDLAQLGDVKSHKLTKEFVRITKVLPGATAAEDVYEATGGDGRTISIQNIHLARRIIGVAAPRSAKEFKEQLTATRDPAGREHTHYQLLIPEQMFIKSPRIVFRGDSRAPAEVFKTGFTARETHVAPIFRTAQAAQSKFDINPNSAVAVSPNPVAASLFPLEGGRIATGRTYVYLVATERYVDTAALQEWARDQLPRRAEAIQLLLFARELTLGTEGAHAPDVIAAVEVTRTEVTEDHFTLAAGAVTENKKSPLLGRPDYQAALAEALAITEWRRA